MNIHWIAISDLSFVDREEMYLLSSIHFANVNRDAFDAMLSQKTWVLLLRDVTTGHLTAFVPLCLHQQPCDPSCYVVLDSNEVVADPQVWPGLGLASAWVAVMNSLRRLCAPHRVHWIFLCGHPRIYRLLARFWQLSYPHPEAALPAAYQKCLGSLLAHRGDYDPVWGTIRCAPLPRRRRSPRQHRLQDRPQDRPQDKPQDNPLIRLGDRLLSPSPAQPNLGEDTDPLTAFFIAQNPHYEQGDRLVCWIDIDPANLTPQGRRYSQPRQAARLKAMSQQVDAVLTAR